MSIRITTAAGVAVAVAALSFVVGVPAANADPGPPPPVSTNGHKVQLVASGLMTPTSFAFGHGRVFVGDGGNSEGSGPPNGGVYVLKKGSAVKIPSALKFVGGLAWHRNALYISGATLTSHGPSWRLVRWSHWNGTTFKARKTLFVANRKLDGLNGIGFGNNGRLYVGVDVGLTDGNDHGPASTSRKLYDILSFRANGSNERVFAKGIRQPWQMVFRGKSNSPYVTDLGQDSGAKNPPDFVLHVKAGQNYGFPKCNHTNAKKCRGYAKPFRKFGPHTDLMGIAARSGKLYLSSFLGRKGQGPGGEVFSLRIKGGHLKPLMKGFVAPTVGLGLHNGYVYVGELTGQVFRVKV
jgi:glucose/arabinose dehydrogenase